ncbi:hypothetical protein CDAR_509431 [Caerostris darwini]|uniref:Uncharacterized protein n=1 Tax=Caerostris darwini TaxID=1538125 RepID=A0AAV4S4Z3_9ARAC|nr:hypothetical protein CDAR_509431 [Caerostris darwini]
MQVIGVLQVPEARRTIPKQQPVDIMPLHIKHPLPQPQMRDCLKFTQETKAYDAVAEEEKCGLCNQMVNYQLFRVCGCGYRPVDSGQQMMMGDAPQLCTPYGDQPFVPGKLEPLYLFTG